MNEIERTYYQDISEKKKAAIGAKHKATKGKHAITVHNQSDYLTPKERKQLSSEPIVFKDSPMDKSEFYNLTQLEQKSYIRYLMTTYNVTGTVIAKMFDIAPSWMYRKIKTLGLSDLLDRKRRMSKDDKIVWDRFIASKPNNNKIINVKNTVNTASNNTSNNDKVLTMNSISLSSDNKNMLLDDIFKVLDNMVPNNCRIDVSFKITQMEDE